MNVKSTNKLTFGISLGPVPPWSRLVGWARLVESLGFDKIWLPDHFVNPGDKNADWYDCWTVLTALAAQTDKIILGNLVASMTLRNPAILARMALTVDHISGGRLELGVGAAGSKNCHMMTGVPNWEPRERSERYSEFVQVLDHMLNNHVTTFHGKYYEIQEAVLQPQFIAKPHPVFNVAAHGPKSLRLAARYGDAWNSYSLGKGLTPKQSSDVIRQRCEMLCEYAIQEGRDPLRIGRTFIFGYTTDGLFRSMDAFYGTVGRYFEAGINDFCFIYAPGLDFWKEQTITSEDLLRQIAQEAIPYLKSVL